MHYKGTTDTKGATSIPPVHEDSVDARELALHTPCRGMDETALVTALSCTHAELVLIHPFREGNGRCARLLGSLMALQAGWPPLDFSPLSGRGRAGYFAAIHVALAHDYAPLARCFSRVLARTSRAVGV